MMILNCRNKTKKSFSILFVIYRGAYFRRDEIFFLFLLNNSWYNVISTLISVQKKAQIPLKFGKNKIKVMNKKKSKNFKYSRILLFNIWIWLNSRIRKHFDGSFKKVWICFNSYFLVFFTQNSVNSSQFGIL